MLRKEGGRRDRGRDRERKEKEKEGGGRQERKERLNPDPLHNSINKNQYEMSYRLKYDAKLESI